MMQYVGRRYVPYINHEYGRTGTLWEGRFKSSAVDSQAYLLTCMRYIELNPVRAGIVQAPEDYPWSSYAANAFGGRDELLTPHELYAALGADAESRSEVLPRIVSAAPGAGGPDPDSGCLADGNAARQ
jgi:REP-associated tyrosine transposase